MPPRKKSATPSKDTLTYRHPEADLPARPEIGAQAHFKKRRPPATYRFDSSLAPELNWDGQNPAREQGEALLRAILDATTLEEAQAAAAHLKALGRPFLNWTGKAERLSFEVPTLPLFVHERLSTKAILETLKGHRKDKQLGLFDALFGATERPLSEQVRSYEHRDEWVNRMILGDSLVVMNSLLHYESLGGQVQMIYMDPPYGVKFGSNFQPFVRKRDVTHNDDEALTREPEMVQAYRDTWELGLHSYLTYLRDRLLLCRELLAPTGSVFVQISDENLHHVRELMDEVFGAENFVSVIVVQKTTSATAQLLASTADYLLWYARDRERCTFQRMFSAKADMDSIDRYDQIELPDGTRRAMTLEEKGNPPAFPPGARRFQLDNLTSTRPPGDFQVELGKETYRPRTGYWKTGPDGMKRLIAAARVVATEGGTLRYVRFLDDSSCSAIGNLWTDISGSVQSRSDPKVYVVQTATSVIQRCMLMTTNPGDLVIDPTCGSGTTALVAEQWGRRWITVDTSRVPLALARQRLLTATFDFFDLADDSRGPAGGFIYKRRQNQKGDEVGGIVPHITLGSIANDEPAAEEVLVDRPEVKKGVVRVTGPFTFEATIAAAEGLDTDPKSPGIQSQEHQSHVERMIEVLRHAPTLRLAGNQSAMLRQVRPPAKTLALSAEAVIGGANGNDGEPVAILFGPADGPLSERLVREAWDEAGLKHYSRLFVIGFGIDPKARTFIERAGEIGIPCIYLQATMDLQMGDLLKNMRSSQVFSVCGLPDIKVRRADSKESAADQWEVELLGLDSFDPATMEALHFAGQDVPAWFLDTDYNGMVFRVRQAFFPRTGAWESLKKALKADLEDTVWDHLAGTTSAPFAAGENRQIAVKVIDPRGNELVAIEKLGDER